MRVKDFLPILAHHPFETQEEGDGPPRKGFPEITRDTILKVGCRPSGAPQGGFPYVTADMKGKRDSPVRSHCRGVEDEPQGFGEMVPSPKVKDHKGAARKVDGLSKMSSSLLFNLFPVGPCPLVKKFAVGFEDSGSGSGDNWTIPEWGQAERASLSQLFI